MKHYCYINESGFKFHFYSLFWRVPPPPKTLRKLHQNGVFWVHFEVLINLNGHFYNWKFIRKKFFSLYIDYMYTCISNFFFFENTLILLHLNLIGNTIKCVFLCRLRSIATHRDHFVRRLSVRLSICRSVCHTFQSYVSQATHAFLEMLPLFLLNVF